MTNFFAIIPDNIAPTLLSVFNILSLRLLFSHLSIDGLVFEIIFLSNTLLILWFCFFRVED